MKNKIILISTLFLKNFVPLNAQNNLALLPQIDSLNYKNNYSKINNYILPSLGLSYGIVAIKNKNLQLINNNIKTNLVAKNFKTKVDDYLVFAPGVLVYGLNFAGLKSKNNFTNRSFIYTLTLGLTLSITVPLKDITNITRPDNSDNFSFPSGHTSIAFANAEFMFQEYKHKNIWLASSGYLIASATGILRMYNNKHWLSDVIAGAGVGIVSTKLVYYIYPKIKKIIGVKTKQKAKQKVAIY